MPFPPAWHTLLWDGYQDAVHHPGSCVLRDHAEHLLPCNRRDETAGGGENRPGYRQGGNQTTRGKAQGAHHDHLPGEEAMEPKGKLNDREPARREREIPGGPVFAVCGQTCGQAAHKMSQQSKCRTKIPLFAEYLDTFKEN